MKKMFGLWVLIAILSVMSVSAVICSDTDGGDDYWVKGQTYGLYPDNSKLNKSDSCMLYNASKSWEQNNFVASCSSDNPLCSLTEYYCKDTTYVTTLLGVRCPYGCSEGKCLQKLQADNVRSCQDVNICNSNYKYITSSTLTYVLNFTLNNLRNRILSQVNSNLINYYNMTAVNILLDTHYYTQTEINNMMQRLDNYYTKYESDNNYPSRAELTNYYTKSEADAKFTPVGFTGTCPSDAKLVIVNGIITECKVRK